MLSTKRCRVHDNLPPGTRAMQLRMTRVILFVEDIPKLVAFYRDILGLKIKGPSDDHTWVEFDAGGACVALHNGGKPRTRAERAPKIVFGSDDVAGARAELIARGGKMGKLMQF